MTNQQAITILQGMIEKLSKADGGEIVEALQMGKLALLALGDIAAEKALPEIARLCFVDREISIWFPASYETILEWNEET